MLFYLITDLRVNKSLPLLAYKMKLDINYGAVLSPAGISLLSM
ncbi:hypothetical protein EC2860050_1216 [Escherichia coli 2860050]|nr:hypothetical protein EC2860050_1216 [Escherichia coli 2860050]